MCDMTHSYVWHDSFICVTWLFHMCDMTCSYVWHDSLIGMTWLILMCDMTDRYDGIVMVSISHVSHTWMSHVTHISKSHVTHMNVSCHTCEWVMSHRSTSHVTQINESCPTMVIPAPRIWYYRFCYVYCATLQGSLDWVETDLRPRPASLLRVIWVLSILDGYCSTLLLMGTVALYRICSTGLR